MTKKLIYLLVIGSLMAALIASGASAKSQVILDPGTKFYVPKVNKGATEQIADLTSSGNKADANLIKQLVQTPQAVWFTKGTPKTVMQDVRNTVARAADKGQVPVLVAYNIPFRDCAQYSAGGATKVDEYKAWIDGFAAGIGNKKAVVILEPDGLGIIPYYTNIDGGMDWCQPLEADPATAASDRFLMLNYAVDTLKALPNVSVYLDGTHSSWLNVADNAQRLIRAGVQRADGFYLNVSNYQFTPNSVAYGSWVSKCITYVAAVNPGGYSDCGNQYWNGGPATNWSGATMDRYQQWRNEPYSGNPADLAWNTVGIDSRYDMILGGVQPAIHFVIDTSRNGQGPWQPPVGYSDPQDWCNPPDRGLGYRPTANTGIALVDAYLWVKLPGESDGECTRGQGPAGTTVDPEWNRIDPAAGAWFPEMALDLVHNANPPLP